jgi:hypothetical protein
MTIAELTFWIDASVRYIRSASDADAVGGSDTAVTRRR